MIFLDPNNVKVRRAKKAFYDQVMIYLYKSIDKILKGDDILQQVLFDIYILPYLDCLIIGSPLELESLNKLISPIVQGNPDFKKKLKEVFIIDGYDEFSKKNINKIKIKYDAYALARGLDIETCVYCNRNYTNTIISIAGKKLSRPQFDHFLDKAENPQFALSFFNLIPSCSVCNASIKTKKNFKIRTHIHPYLHNKLNKFLFTYKYDNQSKNGVRVKVKDVKDKRVSNTINDFALEEVYNGNSYLLNDLLKIRSAFSDRYLSNIETFLLKDITVSRDELYRLVFGTEMEEVNFHKRPFSKFKSDILKELGIIKI